jgi:ParB/RepB/Spo0J family partition protein
MASSLLANTLKELGTSLDTLKQGAQLIDVKTAQLAPYSRQTRKLFDANEMKQLAASIKDLGVVVPLIIRPRANNQFEIIAGERRWRAAKMVSLNVLPALSRNYTDDEADQLHLLENIQRENLSTLELATRVLSDYEAAGQSLAPLIRKYGLAKPKLSKLLALAQGGELMHALVKDGVTANQSVLADVSRLERKDKTAAAELVNAVRAAPKKALRTAERYKAEKKRTAPKPDTHTKGKTAPVSRGKRADSAAQEPAWRSAGLAQVGVKKLRIQVKLSASSQYHAEFKQLVAQHGSAQLSLTHTHPEAGYVAVEFGDRSVLTRIYPATELQLLSASTGAKR